MSIYGVEHVVKKGDTLWGLAEKHLGSGMEWPRIYKFNNRPHVLKTGTKRIVNPDLIYVGDRIRLPISPEFPQLNKKKALSQPRPTGKLNDQLYTIRSPLSFGYSLSDFPITVLYGPGYFVEIAMRGTLVLSTDSAVEVGYVSNFGVTKAFQKEAENAALKLVESKSFTFNPVKKKISYKNGLIVKAKNHYVPDFSVFFSMSSDSGFIPHVVAEAYCPQLSGKFHVERYLSPVSKKIGSWIYTAGQVKIMAKITAMPASDGPPTAPVTKPFSFRPQPVVPVPAVANGINWKVVGATTLAGVIVAAVIIEDFFPIAGGPLNDAAGIALAARLIQTARAASVAAPAVAPAFMGH